MCVKSSKQTMHRENPIQIALHELVCTYYIEIYLFSGIHMDIEVLENGIPLSHRVVISTIPFQAG